MSDWDSGPGWRDILCGTDDGWRALIGDTDDDLSVECRLWSPGDPPRASNPFVDFCPDCAHPGHHGKRCKQTLYDDQEKTGKCHCCKQPARYCESCGHEPHPPGRCQFVVGYETVEIHSLGHSAPVRTLPMDAKTCLCGMVDDFADRFPTERQGFTWIAPTHLHPGG
jgi:hypothetical protein